MSVNLVNVLARAYLFYSKDDDNAPVEHDKIRASVYVDFPDATEAQIRAALHTVCELAEAIELGCRDLGLEPTVQFGPMLDFLRCAAGTGNMRAFKTLRLVRQLYAWP